MILVLERAGRRISQIPEVEEYTYVQWHAEVPPPMFFQDYAQAYNPAHYDPLELKPPEILRVGFKLMSTDNMKPPIWVAFYIEDTNRALTRRS